MKISITMVCLYSPGGPGSTLQAVSEAVVHLIHWKYWIHGGGDVANDNMSFLSDSSAQP